MNDLWIDIYIRPSKPVEYISIPLTITGSPLLLRHCYE